MTLADERETRSLLDDLLNQRLQASEKNFAALNLSDNRFKRIYGRVEKSWDGEKMYLVDCCLIGSSYKIDISGPVIVKPRDQADTDATRFCVSRQKRSKSVTDDLVGVAFKSNLKQARETADCWFWKGVHNPGRN